VSAEELRATLSPTGPAADGQVRIATWNLNSLKQRLPAVERFLERARPDVLCLQETKAATLSEAAVEAFGRHGYEGVHVGANSYNGVAIVTRHPLRDVVASGAFADEHLDREPRLISAIVDVAGVDLRVASVYVPHGRTVGHWHYDYKLAFLDALAARAAAWLAGDDTTTAHVVVTGDLNVAATDSDVFHPDAFVGSTHVTPGERAALGRVLDVGLVDVEVARAWRPRSSLHLVEPRHRLRPEPRDAARRRRRRPRPRRSPRRDLDRPRRAGRRAAVRPCRPAGGLRSSTNRLTRQRRGVTLALSTEWLMMTKGGGTDGCRSVVQGVRRPRRSDPA
jgi:exodeoxyribonuclease-3